MPPKKVRVDRDTLKTLPVSTTKPDHIVTSNDQSSISTKHAEVPTNEAHTIASKDEPSIVIADPKTPSTSVDVVITVATEGSAPITTTPAASPTASDTSVDAESFSTSWRRIPRQLPSPLGKGFFPFVPCPEDPSKSVIQDLEFRGTVIAAFLGAQKEEWSHKIELHVTEEYVDKIKNFVRRFPDYPAVESSFNWNLIHFEEGKLKMNFLAKQELKDDFDSVWDGRGLDEAQLHNIEERKELSHLAIRIGAKVMIEAVPEIWKQPSGLQGCTLHLSAVGLLADAPPIESGSARQEEVLNNYVWTSPKKKRRTTVVLKKE